jgi:hypothetical protein
VGRIAISSLAPNRNVNEQDNANELILHQILGVARQWFRQFVAVTPPVVRFLPDSCHIEGPKTSAPVLLPLWQKSEIEKLEPGRRHRCHRDQDYLDQRSDLPERYRAIDWVEEQLYTVIFEARENAEGKYYHLVTLWKATKQE